MDKFRPHSMTKTNLACLYFPDESVESARRRLTRWIDECPPLAAALRELGYKKRRHYFTSAQVKKIIAYFGDPMPVFP